MLYNMTQAKKVLYIITKSNFGGAQKYVFELATGAQAAGYNVTVACGGTGLAGAALGLMAEKLTAESISVIPIKQFLRDMSLGRDLLALLEIIKIIRKIRPDVIHVTSSKAGGIGALAGRLCRVPQIIFTSHGLTMDETWRPKWQQWLIWFGTWSTLSLAHVSIMISTETYNRARLLPRLSNKVVLIKNGLAPFELLDKNVARAKLAPNVPQQSLWIGGIGELHPNKNWSALIEAMEVLPNSVQLLLIGEGEERATLTALIDQRDLLGRVHLLGFKDAPQYLSAFDIFVLPSKKEGLPYVLLEAGFASLPVVASDLPGNQDIIQTGETGFLVEGTPKMLGASLEMLTRDEAMRRRLGSALHTSVTKTFSIEQMRSDTFALYDSSKSRT
jgi:glycosyltransferase involved in cell wall biosynthesis